MIKGLREMKELTTWICRREVFRKGTARAKPLSGSLPNVPEGWREGHPRLEPIVLGEELGGERGGGLAQVGSRKPPHGLRPSLQVRRELLQGFKQMSDVIWLWGCCVEDRGWGMGWAGGQGWKQGHLPWD